MHRDQLERVKQATPEIYRMMNMMTLVMGGTMRREFVGILPTAAEIQRLPRANSIPTIVLSSTQPSAGETLAFRALATQLQTELAAEYAADRHEFISGSGHYIQRDQPQAVIRAARELAGCRTADAERSAQLPRMNPPSAGRSDAAANAI